MQLAECNTLAISLRRTVRSGAFERAGAFVWLLDVC